MEAAELMSEADIHAFGVEILYKQLESDGWSITSADINAERATEPQIVGHKDGETAFFIVRTAAYPARGRFEEGQKAFEDLVNHAKAHGATCYYASIGIANSEGKTEAEMSVPVKGVAFNIQFEGLVQMELADSVTKGENASGREGAV